MDRETLAELLRNAGDRQFWIVLWGDPNHELREGGEKITDLVLEHWFSKNPASMKKGDILFMHRIKAASLMYVGEMISEARKSTREEIEQEPGHERWAWKAGIRNLTPTFGANWFSYRLKTFALNKEYNEINLQDQVNIGRLKFGAPVRIPLSFARFLLNHIIGSSRLMK